jgi:hypothetical protein
MVELLSSTHQALGLILSTAKQIYMEALFTLSPFSVCSKCSVTTITNNKENRGRSTFPRFYPGATRLQSKKLAPSAEFTEILTDLDLVGWPYVPQYLPQLHLNLGKALIVQMTPTTAIALQRGRIPCEA